MEQQLTPSQQHWFDLAAMHADDFATRAEEHDRENTFPLENYEAMKASGYTNMCVPEELGGGGARMLDICIAHERLARGDGSTALAVNMHNLYTLILAEDWRAGKKKAGPVLEDIAKKRLIGFGPSSETGLDTLFSLGSWNYSITKAERVDGGFRINGHKFFGTGGPAADLMNSTAMYHNEAEGDVLLFFTIPKDTPGLVCQNDWDTLGMRATSSHSWVCENVFVPDNKVTRSKPLVWDRMARTLFALNGGSFGAVYLGIARAARDFAIEYTKNRIRVPHEHPVSYYPSSQFLAAEMDIGLKAAWAFQIQVSTRLSDPQTWDDIDTLMDGMAAQYVSMHTAVDVVNKALELVGGTALAKRLPLERYYRDVRSGPIHPISGYDALEIIGKHAFGIPLWGAKPRWV